MVLKQFTDKSDEELASLVSSQSEAYDVLMERYEEKLMRYIKRLARLNEQEAEDILQDVFLKAYTHINDFDTSLKFSSWIYRITHNAVISEHRKWSKRKTEPIEAYLDGVKQLMDDINIEEEYDKKFTSAVINKALASLPIKEREALELYYLEGFSIQEICDILKKPTGSIATLMRRGKQKLLKYLNRFFPSLI